MNLSYENCFISDGCYSIKDYIDRILSLQIEKELYMQYVGPYKWCGQWENGARRVLQLFLIKGDSAIFEWGYNYQFLPIIKGGKIIYQRTDKNMQAQLRSMPTTFIDFGDWKPFCIPMHAKREDKLIERIKSVFDRTNPDIINWFERTASVEAMIKEADLQIQHGNYYSYFYPSQQYVKAFLLSANNQIKQAVVELEASDMYQEASEENRNKLKCKLLQINNSL